MSIFSLDPQERRRALDELNAQIGESLRYYLGPTPIPQLLGFAAEMTPSRTVERASEASMRVAAPGLTPMQRIAAGGEALGETAAVVFPLAAGARGALPMSEAVQEALMGVSIPARAVGQAVAERATQPGPMPRTLYSNPLMRAEEEAAGIRAYHGSPYTFERFDVSKIGTGEGAQAYGRGLYFAEKEDVARGYRDALSDFVPGINGVPLSRLETTGGGEVADAIANRMVNAGINDVYEAADSVARTTDAAWPEIMAARDWLASKVENVGAAGRMYEVNIAGQPEDFLDWDKPLGEQSQRVRDAFASLGSPERLANVRGEDAYRALQNQLGAMDWPVGADVSTRRRFYDEGAANASNALREAGIPGIRYLDAVSRGAGGGTRNFVVFDDRLISIVRMYGIGGAAALLGVTAADVEQALAENLPPSEWESLVVGPQ